MKLSKKTNTNNKKKSPIKTKPDQQEKLLFYQKKLFQKLYQDLFITMPSIFQENSLTFENFVYIFAKKIQNCFDFKTKNPSYNELVSKVKKIIIEKYTINSNTSPQSKKLMQLRERERDDWAIVSKYQSQLYEDEEQKRLIEIAKGMKEYYNDLKKQEEEKETYLLKEEAKRKEEKEKKLKEEKIQLEQLKMQNKNKIEKLLENEYMLKKMNVKYLEEVAQRGNIQKEYIKELLIENENLNKENKDIVKFKIDNIARIHNQISGNYVREKNLLDEDNERSKMVDLLIKKRNEKKLSEVLMLKKGNDVQVNDIEGIDKELEERVNKIMRQKILKK